jgi:hypothetical protein
MTRRSQANKTSRRRNSKEFKGDVLARAERLRVTAAAKGLALHESQLYWWRLKTRAERDQNETERDPSAESARFKRRVTEQAEELTTVERAGLALNRSLRRKPEVDSRGVQNANIFLGRVLSRSATLSKSLCALTDRWVPFGGVLS